MKARIREIMEESIAVKRAFLESPLEPVVGAVNAIASALRQGRKLLLFGNGGSAADAQHIACEFVNRFLRDRPALPAVALTTDTSVLTSVANDDAFQEIFARQVQALGAPGDVAWGISTSGASPNVVRGLQEGRGRGLITVGMTGGSGETMGKIVDHWIHVPFTGAPRVQEAQIAISHIICALVEEILFPGEREGEA